MTDNIDSGLMEEERKEQQRRREYASQVQAMERGITARNLAQANDLARAMSQSRSMLPMHLRGSHGDCTGIVSTALTYKMDPYMLGRMTYYVGNQMQFYAALVHSRLRTSGILRHSLKIEFEGEGDERCCIITGHLITDPKDMGLVYRSPPKRICRSKSTLWDTDPDTMLTYMAQKRWVNLKCPEVMLGMYPEYGEADAEGEIIENAEFSVPHTAPELEVPDEAPLPEAVPERINADGEEQEDAPDDQPPKRKRRAKAAAEEDVVVEEAGE